LCLQSEIIGTCLCFFWPNFQKMGHFRMLPVLATAAVFTASVAAAAQKPNIVRSVSGSNPRSNQLMWPCGRRVSCLLVRGG
jgi:hypothetical protein